jgi:hypothetical protein
MSNPEVNRIRQDMARCNQRITEIRAGIRGVHTGQWVTVRTGEHGAGLAHERQLLAQETALHRLESEYLNAMIADNAWPPAVIIAKMQAAPLAPQVIERPPSGDDIKAAVREFLSQVPDDATVASLKELIQ